MATDTDLQQIYFTVDSELLRELGQRLVGRQYIALAELVKNSFDADASRVEVRISDDCIEVSDNGHGMTYEDFSDRWMRVGSTHKVQEVTSPELHRPLTGSKGVGRLAVQFLASELELTSVPKANRVPTNTLPQELYAMVDWDTAVQAGDLTQATALYDLGDPRDIVFPLGKPHGTTVRLRRLKHEWSPQEFEELAREVWFLQPPFRSLSGSRGEEDDSFEVELFAPDPQAVVLFNNQMSRILDLYSSRLVGKLLPPDGGDERSAPRKLLLSLELEHHSKSSYEYRLPIRDADKCLIDRLDFEIRIFTLRNRLPYGIPVQVAREYMSRWGGIHIYDAGFRIPYAGAAADWLNLEFDHSHRLTQSQLLPAELNVPMGLNYLPTNSRVLGAVHIDTTREARVANGDRPSSNTHLQIQVSRDRLVDNGAFRQLRDAVRFALHYYATRLAAVRLQEKLATRAVQTPKTLVENVWNVLDTHADEIPPPVVKELRTSLGKTIESIRQQADWTTEQSGLLGAMATAGMTAVAFDHQFHQQLAVLEHHTNTLHKTIEANPSLTSAVRPVVADLKNWIRNTRDTYTLFLPIADERNRTAVGRFIAKALIRDLASNMKVLLRGVRVDVSSVERDVLLPKSSYTVWMAIFQNILINSYNAMIDCQTKRISVSSFRRKTRRGLWIQDTGVGIDLDKADDLFKPLQRGLEISPDRRALGYGGTGLGLAIVRMLARDLRTDVRFVKPLSPFNTRFEIAWSEES